MARATLRSAAFLVSAVLVTGSMLPPTAQAAPATSYAGDPRSGAALNLLAAKAARDRLPDRPSGPGLAPTLPPNLVNKPGLDATAQDTQSETTIAVAGPNLVAAYNDSGSFLGGESHFTGYSVSTNGGATWTDKGQLPDSSEGDGGDPVVAVNSTTGRVYLATLGFNTGDRVQVFRSDDNGLSFGPPVNGTPGFVGSGAFQDKSWITVDNFTGGGQGNVYLGWRQFGGPSDGVKFTRSVNDGNSFTPSGGTTIVAGDGQGADLVVAPNHCLHFFYLDDIFGGNIIRVRTSCDRGQSFAPPVTITNLTSTGINGDLGLNGGLRSNGFPQAAVNPVTGTLYVVYNDLNAAQRSDVFLKTSDDGGATWSARIRINTDSTGTDQFFPTVAVTADGRRLLVGYYDRRNDPDNLDLQRTSRQGLVNTTTDAITWRRPFQLSPAFPVVIGQDPVINTTYMGDYDQIAANGTTFFTTWGDNRDSNAFHNNQPDVRSASVPAAVGTTNIGVTLSENRDPVPVGATLSYTATITNSSSVSAANLYLDSQLPAGTTFLSAAPTSGSGGRCYRLDDDISCELGALAAGQTRTVLIRLQPTLAGTIIGNAAVSTSTDETVTVNNTDTESTTATP